VEVDILCLKFSCEDLIRFKEPNTILKLHCKLMSTDWDGLNVSLSYKLKVLEQKESLMRRERIRKGMLDRNKKCLD
jgi:hypothetical protein